MRYALTDAEWRLISPILPCKPRGVPRVDDRRVLNGVFWVLRSGVPWRDLPERCARCSTPSQRGWRRRPHCRNERRPVCCERRLASRSATGL